MNVHRTKQAQTLLSAKAFFLLACLLVFPSVWGQSTTGFKLLPLGDMNHWMVRQVKESGIIGGNTRYLYEVAKGDTLVDKPYQNPSSPWAVSSVLAKVKGITKVSSTVFPEERGNGKAARLETRIENVKVLGIININVLAAGTLFLGEMVEPITDTNNPLGKLNAGIPFTKHPKALQFDYKVQTGGSCIRSTGFSRQKKLDQTDQAEVFLYLQHRWEDAEGKVYAKRVATAQKTFSQSNANWTNAYQLPLKYGNLSAQAKDNKTLELKQGEEAYYTRNSKGKMVPIQEVGWAKEEEQATHLILQFSSSNGGPYIGSTDSRLWIDNIGFVY